MLKSTQYPSRPLAVSPGRVECDTLLIRTEHMICIRIATQPRPRPDLGRPSRTFQLDMPTHCTTVAREFRFNPHDDVKRLRHRLTRQFVK